MSTPLQHIKTLLSHFDSILLKVEDMVEKSKVGKVQNVAPVDCACKGNMDVKNNAIYKCQCNALLSLLGAIKSAQKEMLSIEIKFKKCFLDDKIS